MSLRRTVARSSRVRTISQNVWPLSGQQLWSGAMSWIQHSFPSRMGNMHSLTWRREMMITFYLSLRDGGFRPLNFENTILSYGLGMMATTWEWFWGHARNTTHVMPRSKNGSKTENFKNVLSSLARRVDHFGVFECQNRIENDRVIPIESWGKSGILAYFWLKIGYIIWYMDQICFAKPFILILRGKPN